MSDLLRWVVTGWFVISPLGLLGALSIGWWLRGWRDRRQAAATQPIKEN